MQRLSHVTLILACAMVGCARHDIVPGVSDSAVVAAMADFRRVQGSTSDTVVLAAARRRILQQRGLTVELMDRAGRALANDPQRAADLFDAVDKRAVNVVADSSHRAPTAEVKK